MRDGSARGAHARDGSGRGYGRTVDFDLSPEQVQFRHVVRDFAEAEIAPYAARLGRASTRFPVDTVLAMGRLGLFGLPFPEEYGGGGADYLTYCLAIEELARVDASMAITLEAGVSLGAAPFLYSGTEAQKQEYLVPMIAGEVLGAFGLTEAEAGSDAGATRTRAVLDDDAHEWVVDGQKTFITNSGTPITKCVTITARTGDNEISNIVVDAGTPGFTVMAPYRKMGWHASDTHELLFDGLPRARRPSARRRAAKGSRRSCASSTRGASRSPRSRWASRRAASTRPSRTRASAGRSAGRSAGTSRSRSSAPTWPSRSRTPATSPTRPRACATPACRSARRRRWRSCTQVKLL